MEFAKPIEEKEQDIGDAGSATISLGRHSNILSVHIIHCIALLWWCLLGGNDEEQAGYGNIQLIVNCNPLQIKRIPSHAVESTRKNEDVVSFNVMIVFAWYILA